MGTEPKMRTKRYLQNHVVYQRTEMILRNPLASPVRGNFGTSEEYPVVPTPAKFCSTCKVF